MKIIKIIAISFAVLIAVYIGGVIWATYSDTHSVFVRADQVDEAAGKRYNAGLYKTILKHDWGTMSIMPPLEISPHAVPQLHPPGKFETQISFYDITDPTFESAKLRKLEFQNVTPGGDIETLQSKHWTSKRHITNSAKSGPGEITIEIPTFFFILDIPKKVKSFNIVLEIEIDKEGGAEIVEFQETFYRTTYLYRYND